MIIQLPQFATDQELNDYLSAQGYTDEPEGNPIVIMEGYSKAATLIVWDEQQKAWRLVYSVVAILEQIIDEIKEEEDSHLIYLTAVEHFTYNMLPSLASLPNTGPLMDYGAKPATTAPQTPKKQQKPAKRQKNRQKASKKRKT